MVQPERFERSASSFGGKRSIQLSYGCLNDGLDGNGLIGSRPICKQGTWLRVFHGKS